MHLFTSAGHPATPLPMVRPFRIEEDLAVK